MEKTYVTMSQYILLFCRIRFRHFFSHMFDNYVIVYSFFYRCERKQKQQKLVFEDEVELSTLIRLTLNHRSMASFSTHNGKQISSHTVDGSHTTWARMWQALYYMYLLPGDEIMTDIEALPLVNTLSSQSET